MMRSKGLSLIAILVAGCSTGQPHAPVSAPAKVEATRPTATALAAGGTSSTAAVQPAKPFEPPVGYKIRKEGTQTYYCAKIVVLGSRFPKDDCRTQEEFETMAMLRAKMRGDMNQRTGTCTSASAACAMP